MDSNTKTAPGVRQVPAEQQKTTTERPWNVILWNDPVNNMSYVTFVLQRVFGYATEMAQKLMLEAHTQGKAVVSTEGRETAELHAAQLHAFGLQATIARAGG